MKKHVDKEMKVQRGVLLVACLAALAYGLSVRLLYGTWEYKARGPLWLRDLFEVMSIGLVFVTPLSIGFLTTYLGRVSDPWRAVLLPVLPAVVCLGVALLLAWEGLICVVLFLPLFAVLAMLGGTLAYFMLRWQNWRTRSSVVGAVMLLPLMVAPVENLVDPPQTQRVVANSIVIHADAARVWAQIVQVPAITEAEHSFALTHMIGFPRPIAATLQGVGVGSVRHATFERGVLFLETVTRWEENKALEFTIHADPDSIPPKALDEHVTVGGPYFDVLSGAYAIEQLPEGGVLLHLSSEHRLSTRFNFYSSLWTDFIMSDTQQYILEVIKRRCE
jgi:hypothetical protein